MINFFFLGGGEEGRGDIVFRTQLHEALYTLFFNFSFCLFVSCFFSFLFLFYFFFRFLDSFFGFLGLYFLLFGVVTFIILFLFFPSSFSSCFLSHHAIADIAGQALNIFLHGQESARKNAIVKTFTHTSIPIHPCKLLKQRAKPSTHQTSRLRLVVLFCPVWRWETVGKLRRCPSGMHHVGGLQY